MYEYIATVTCCFAKESYLAIAPDLFARLGDPKAYTELTKLRSGQSSKVLDAQFMADLDASVQMSAENGVNANKVTITGFCRLGHITWHYAEHNLKVKAGLAW